MSYIDNNLMNGEQVIYRTKLHWIKLFGPIALNVISIILFKESSTKGLLLLIGSLWFISALVTYLTSEFGVTNKRVLIKYGFIKRISLETYLNKIEGIVVNQGVLGRILNYGSIIVKGTGGTNNPFKEIKAPLDFRKSVQENIPQ